MSTRRQGKNKAADQAASPSPTKRPRGSASDKSSSTASSENDEVPQMRIPDSPTTAPASQRGASVRGNNAEHPSAARTPPLSSSAPLPLVSTQSLSASLAQSSLAERTVSAAHRDEHEGTGHGDDGEELSAMFTDLPDYIPDELLPRLQRLCTFSEPAMHRYSIRCIPEDARWGIGKNGRTSQYDRFLCHNGKPLVIWMVGVVKYVHLTDSERFSIGIGFLSDADADAANRNLGGRCCPPREPEDDSFTFIGKWVNSGNRENEQTFDNVYDAVDRELHGWNADAKIAASRIQVSDIVMVECYIKRFKNKSLNNGMRGWNAWGVQYELLRIAQLCVGPGFVDEPPPDSCATI
ncbi:hypothetical protein FKP32DRAFT_1679687 [Trametes sanguinea]|nr:hypothetical protein FKP32DRAFT_1679687 [Trametes sanguinea]